MKLAVLLIHFHFLVFIEKLAQEVENIEPEMVDCKQVELQVFIFFDNVNFWRAMSFQLSWWYSEYFEYFW